MKSGLFNLTLVIVLISLCCCPAEKTKAGDASGDIPLRSSPTQIKPLRPNPIKRNVTNIDAEVLSLDLIGEHSYKVYVKVVKATPEEDIDSFASVGQMITLSPEYMVGAADSADMSNGWNQKMFRVRMLKKGEYLKATISLNSKGEWRITGIID